jgi:hypothetical protein
MTPRDRGPHRGETGFVLIGVVIFVLALTIIGISLFSLSSYEAQFFQRSLDAEQAFQSAAGGIERAKFALARDTLLSSVQNSLPLHYVTAATAIQMQGGHPDSTGPVEWQGENVRLRVTAQVNQERRTIECTLKPRLAREVYSQLLATSAGIDVMASTTVGGVTIDRRNTVHLMGPIWQGTMPPDTLDWLPVLDIPWPVGIATDPVALPDAARYLTSYFGSPSPEPWSFDHNGLRWWHYDLFAGAGHVAYFSTPPSMTGDPNFSLYDSDWSYGPTRTGGVMLGVKGCAIWLMPHGIRFNEKVTVLGYSGSSMVDCLIIVAGRSETFPDDPDAGIWFYDGLESNIPVILVSDGRVYIQHMTDPDGRYSNVQEGSIYARDVVLAGPDRNSSPTVELVLQHTPGGPLDSYWVPLLAEGGYLPNVTATSKHRLSLVPGTWRASGR